MAKKKEPVEPEFVPPTEVAHIWMSNSDGTVGCPHCGQTQGDADEFCPRVGM